MTTSFPGTVDSFPRPGPTTNTDDPGFELDVLLDHHSDAIEALESYVRTARPVQLTDTPVGSYAPVLAIGGHSTGSLSTTTQNSQGLMRLTPIGVFGNYSFDLAGLYLSTPATDASAVVGLAVYSVTGALVLDCGTFDATSAAGLKTLGISLSLTPGVYFMGVRFTAPTNAGTNPAFYVTDTAIAGITHSVLDSNNLTNTIRGSSITNGQAFPSQIANWQYIASTGAAGVIRASIRRSA